MIKRKIKPILCLIIIILSSFLIYARLFLQGREVQIGQSSQKQEAFKNEFNKLLVHDCSQTIRGTLSKKVVQFKNEEVNIKSKKNDLSKDNKLLFIEFNNNDFSLTAFAFVSIESNNCYARIY